jgi:hypothetical protein
MAASLERLKKSGFEACTLWVIAENSRACSFYEALGLLPDGATRIEGADTENPVSEIRYRRGFSHAA